MVIGEGFFQKVERRIADYISSFKVTKMTPGDSYI